MRTFVLPVLVAAVVFAGCLDGSGSGDASCPDLEQTSARFPALPDAFLDFSAGANLFDASNQDGWFGVMLAPAIAGVTIRQSFTDGPDLLNATRIEGSAELLNASQPGFYRIGSDLLGRKRGDAAFYARADADEPGCLDQVLGNFTLTPATTARQMASPGQGVHVYTAGFWDNGTLFYTNIQELNDSTWPRAGWYAWEGAAPLPVYVYDQDRSEEPAYWKGLVANYPGTGVAPFDENASAALGSLDTALGLGYYTTIPGFNEGLKGLATTTATVVVLEPEQGYTRAGNEAHPLYGERLVFLIKVVDVVDGPCPTLSEPVPALPCALPTP